MKLKEYLEKHYEVSLNSENEEENLKLSINNATHSILKDIYEENNEGSNYDDELDDEVYSRENGCVFKGQNITVYDDETEKVLEILETDKKLKTRLKQVSSIEEIKPIIWTILSMDYNWDSIALSQIDYKVIYEKTH